MASETVRALPEVREVLAKTLDAIRSKPDLSLGGFGPELNGDGTFSVVIGINSRERIEQVVGYEVNQRTGELSVFAGGDVVVPEAARVAVRRACMK